MEIGAAAAAVCLMSRYCYFYCYYTPAWKGFREEKMFRTSNLAPGAFFFPYSITLNPIWNGSL